MSMTWMMNAKQYIVVVLDDITTTADSDDQGMGWRLVKLVPCLDMSKLVEKKR